MKAKGCVFEASRLWSPLGAAAPPDLLSDESRFGNNGVHTDITWVQLPSGLWVRSFDGITSLIDCGADDSLDSYLKPQGFSLEAWVLANSDGGNDNGKIFYKDWGYELWLRSETIDGCLIEAMVDLVTTDANAITSGRIKIGVWGHIVAVYNRLGTFRIELYLDGQLMALGTDTAGVGGLTDDTGTPLYLGNDGLNYPFDGYQAFLRIHSYALSLDQINKHFEAERRFFGV